MCACPAGESPKIEQRPPGLLRRMVFCATALALFSIVMIFARRPAEKSGPDRSDSRVSSPVDVVAALVDAEQAADVWNYADCFAGPLREKLDARLAEAPSVAFVDELHSRSTNLTGHVTTDIQYPDPDSATLVLERVFKNHNSRSRVRLSRFGGEWKITELTPLDNFTPEIPYGTPVFTAPVGKKSQISNSKTQTNPKIEMQK